MKKLLAGATLVTSGLVLYSAHAQTRRPPGDVWPRPPIIVPPRPIPPRNEELQLQEQRANVVINGNVAKVKLVQKFENPTNRQIEGTYLFPLPKGAAVADFAMTVDGKRMEAEVLESSKARGIYEDIVRRLRDPAILEFAEDDVLRARIFPIAPRASVEVELSFAATLNQNAGARRFTLPQKLPLGGAAEKSSVDIEIKSTDLKAVYSPTNQVEVKRSATGARVTGEWNAASLDARDFSLLYTVNAGKVGLDVSIFQPPGEDPYFLLLAAPDSELTAKELAAKDVVFVFDTSGSMEGEKIEQARRALTSLLGNLNPGDNFNLITFASDVQPFRETLVPASKDNLTAARNFAANIKAVGGTNINDALENALKLLKKNAGRPQQVVFLTDGQPTVGETKIENILKNAGEENNADARLFVFGLGYDVNTRLLDSLAQDNRGTSDYVEPKEDIEEKVGALYRKIAYPVLANPSLEWKNGQVYDVYPPRLPDLFRGTQAIVFGRIRNGGTPSVVLTGAAGGREERVPGEVATTGDTGDTVPRLWAMRKVGYLIDDARRNNRTVPDEVKDEIIKLSKKYGIVTPFTASLITEDSPVTGPVPPGQPRPLPGPTDGATFGGAGGARGGGFGGAYAMPRLAAPATGADAVANSKATRELRDAETSRAVNPENLRTLDGKTFVLRDQVWTDTAYTPGVSPAPKIVKFASAEYFALAKDPRGARWLSVGDRVIVVLGAQTIRIEP